jgi:hypothetical protein
MANIPQQPQKTVVPTIVSPDFAPSEVRAKYRRVSHIRCKSGETTQIAALGGSLDESKHDVEMYLATDMNGVYVYALLAGKMHEYLMPMDLFCHIELETENIKQERLDREAKAPKKA